MSIGIDNLPKHVIESDVYSKEQLDQLATISSIPSVEQLSIIKASPDVKRILDEFDDASQCRDALHGLAQQYLMMDEVQRAAAIVFL